MYNRLTYNWELSSGVGSTAYEIANSFLNLRFFKLIVNRLLKTFVEYLLKNDMFVHVCHLGVLETQQCQLVTESQKLYM